MTVSHNRLRAVPDHVYVLLLHSARSSCECVQSCLCVSYVQPALPLRFYVPESFSSSYIYYTPARALKPEGNGSERSRESTLWKGLPPTEEEDCDQKLWKQSHACYSYIFSSKFYSITFIEGECYLRHEILFYSIQNPLMYCCLVTGHTGANPPSMCGFFLCVWRRSRVSLWSRICQHNGWYQSRAISVGERSFSLTLSSFCSWYWH